MAAQRNVQKKKSKRKNTRRQNQDGNPRSEAPFLQEAPISSAVAEALRAEAAAPTDHGALEEPEASAPKECLTSDASAQTDAKPAAVTAAAERPAETPAGEPSEEEKADERSAIAPSPETDLTEGVDAVSGAAPSIAPSRAPNFVLGAATPPPETAVERKTRTADTSPIAPAPAETPTVSAEPAPLAAANAEKNTADEESAPPAADLDHARSLRPFGMIIGSWAILLLSGALLAFAAANWTVWSDTLRLTIFGGAALLSFLPTVCCKYISRTLQDCSAALGGLLTALLFVVIGQTWQTGDDAASLLLGLSAILTPWLLVIRRPLIFTLWYAALAVGLGLKGFERFGEAPDIFTPMLIAAVFASAAAVVLGLSLRLRPSPGLRASALLPALNFSVLLGLLPPVAFALDNAGLESLAGLALLFLAGALIGSAALWSSRLPELRALAMLTLAGWGNALLILFMHPYLGHLSSTSLGYALTLLNGLVCLAGTLSAARFSRRRTMHAKAQDASSRPDTGPEKSCAASHSLRASLEKAAASAPSVAAGILGALAITLAISTLLMFDVSTFFVEVLFLVIGLTLGGWAAVQARRAQKTNAVKVLSASGITLQTAGLLFAAVGWLMLASDLSGQSPWTMIMPAAALLCAWLFPWRAVLFAALLSPLYVNMPLPGAVAWSDVLFILTLLTGLSVLFGKSAAQRAESLLPALLAAAWTSGLLQPESFVHQPVPTGHFAQIPSIGFMAAAALLLIVCLRGLAADRHRSVSLQRGAAFIAAAAAAVAAVWMLPAASDLLLLSAAILSALSLGGKRLAAAAFIATGGLLFCAADLFWTAAAPGVNPLLEAAKIYGVMGLAFALSSLALCLRRFSGSSVKMFGFGLQQGFALAALMITAAAVAFTALNRIDLLEHGQFRIVRLVPADPRDMLLGDFMALRYAFDDEALQVRQSAEAAVHVEGFCLSMRNTQNPPNDASALNQAETADKLDQWIIVGAKLRRDGTVSACPKGTQWELAALAGEPKVPRRWFFPSGEAHRYEPAAAADFRCLGRNCILAGLLNANGEPIARRAE